MEDKIKGYMTVIREEKGFAIQIKNMTIRDCLAGAVVLLQQIQRIENGDLEGSEIAVVGRKEND